jgi:hypothetical protein
VSSRGAERYLQELPNRAVEVQAAVTVVTRGWSEGEPRLDLHEVDLRGAQLDHTKLWADLTGSTPPSVGSSLAVLRSDESAT